ncbi:OsmC family peroxiredoxin [Klebsiella pneumoniae]|jgi:uncharacterized OsmC-like protein|nr:hypothetical protein DQ02_09645 [Citrobacter amalonaticus]QIV53059.1 OsmC family protein [Klebsiella pneumoniae]RHL66257.1 OsmC family peroxiredoxin [Klebsiella pneumoniae]GKO15886.1 hypothetical protein NUKP99_54370 [Klebsiella variicola]HBZ2451710.1 OsmC family protein [Klebsiella pneumoniae]
MYIYMNNAVPDPLLHQSGSSTDEQVPGKAVFNVSTFWQGGLKSESVCNASIINGQTQAGRGHKLSSDEPELLGGNGSAPGPQELLLAAFNACLTAAYVTAARAENVLIDKLNITTSGELDVSRFLGLDSGEEPIPETLRYVITVSGSGSVCQFERIHQSVIATSPNRWIIGKGMLIEGDQIIE